MCVALEAAKDADIAEVLVMDLAHVCWLVLMDYWRRAIRFAVDSECGLNRRRHLQTRTHSVGDHSVFPRPVEVAGSVGTPLVH